MALSDDIMRGSGSYGYAEHFRSHTGSAFGRTRHGIASAAPNTDWLRDVWFTVKAVIEFAVVLAGAAACVFGGIAILKVLG